MKRSRFTEEQIIGILRALAQERRRFGYRRLHVLLRREGHAVNKNRVQRIYREERLTVRGSEQWAGGDRWTCRWWPTSAGRWTSSLTR